MSCACCWLELVDVEECRVVLNGAAIVACGLFPASFFPLNYCCCFFCNWRSDLGRVVECWGGKFVDRVRIVKEGWGVE